MWTVDVDEAAERLYALAPEDFTASRDDLAKQADGASRKAVKGLRKPTVAAYVVNLLVRERAGDIDALLDLGEAMRTAMSSGGDLRGLAEERRGLVADLVAAAAEVADRELTAAI